MSGVRILKYPGLLLLFILLAGSCQEAYLPEDIDSSKNLLVVSGGISDKPGPYTINLQWASSLEKSVSAYISKATVVISDDAGFSEKLTEVKLGTYQTSLLQGIPGRSYKIQIILPDRSRYESDPELLPLPLEIDTMYAEPGDKDFVGQNYEGDILIRNQKGIFVYADLKIPGDKQVYVLMSNMVVTQKTWMPKGMSNPPTVYSRTVRKPDEYPLIKASINYEGGQIIKKFPLGFLAYIPDLSSGTDSTTPYVIMGWIVSTKSQLISYTAYKYFENINRQLKADLRIFDPIVSQVKGNIRCINDSTRAALGYFSLSSEGVKNRFFYWFPGSMNLINKPVTDPGPAYDGISTGVPFEYWVNP